MGFVANFIRFPQCKNFENWLRSDKVTESLKVGTFLRHSVERFKVMPVKDDDANRQQMGDILFDFY